MKKSPGSVFSRKVGVVALALIAVLAGPASGQLAVNPGSREESRIFYQAIFPASENIPSGWNGNLATGYEGTTTAEYKNAMYLRLNYFRAMAGVPANIVDDANFTAAAQKAALMMSSNRTLSHAPPTNWINFSAIGANAAANSNLTLDSGLRAISNYLEDPGADNFGVGHRRWVLYPQWTRMGFGDVPITGTNPAGNALWILDTNTFGGARPSVRNNFVAWPPAGYVPYHFIYPRWSFSYPGANFALATVNVQQNGVNLSVSRELIAPSAGENTLVFIPGGLDPNNWAGPVRPSGDLATTVTINNVLIGGIAQNFSYTVIAFDPATNGGDTVLPSIGGSANPVVGAVNSYNVNPLTLATGYQWKTSRSSAYSFVDGAETGGTVAASVPAGYAFRDNGVKAVGNFSYHLAQPNFQASSFILSSSVVPGPGAVLTFKSRLGYASDTQVAKVQISRDGGALWDVVWSQPGSNTAGQLNFQDRSISLAAYAGQEIWVRFLFDWSTGSIYPQTTAGIGWYIDNIAFSNTQTVAETVTGAVAAGTDFSFTPTAAGTYNLQVRPQVYGKYFLNWSPVRSVVATADGNAPPAVVGTRVLQLSGSLVFGSRPLKSKLTRTLSIRNAGNSPLVINSLVYPAGFSGKWAGTIAPGGTKNIKITFIPTAKKVYKGKVTIRSNATAGITTRALSGKGI